MTMSNKYKFLESIFVLWFVLTLFYILVTYFLTKFDVSVIGNPVGYFFGFIGLFVPYGLLSLPTFILVPGSWYSLIAFTLILLVADHLTKRSPVDLWKRMLLNLAILFFVTMVVDYMRGTPFASWEIFVSGGSVPNSFF